MVTFRLEDIFNTKSALEFYEKVMHYGPCLNVTRKEVPVPLGEILRDEFCMKSGMKGEILPDYIKEVYMDCKRVLREKSPELEIAVNYKNKIHKESIRKHWQEKGYGAKKERNSIIITRGDITIATYGIKKVFIRMSQLREFIENVSDY